MSIDPARWLPMLVVVLLAGCKSDGPTAPPPPADQWTLVGFMPGNTNVLTTVGARMIAGTTIQMRFSDDNGQTWPGASGAGGSVSGIAVRGTTVFAHVPGAIIKSADSGSNFGFTTDFPGSSTNPAAFADLNGTLYVGTVGFGLARSTNDGASWTTLFGTTDFRALLVNGGFLTVAAYGTGGGSLTSGVSDSNDDGATWVNITPGLPSGSQVISLMKVGASNLLAQVEDGRVYLYQRGTLNGFTAVSALDNVAGLQVAFSGTNAFAAMPGKGVARSSNSGQTWTTMPITGLPSNQAKAIAIVGTDVYITVGGQVFKSPIN